MHTKCIVVLDIKGYLVTFEVAGDEHWRNRNMIDIQIWWK
jgi:hypothetical protein